VGADITTPKSNITSAANNNSSLQSFAFPTEWNFETTYHVIVNSVQ
jgi:hypothetical protein